MGIELEPIGYVTTEAEEVPRSWAISDVEGTLVIHEAYFEGLSDIQPGQLLSVIFHFHLSPPFTQELMRVTPPTREEEMGVFSTHSPIRPNPIGLSVLEVLEVDDNLIRVKGLDMVNETPILDIKPFIRPLKIDP
jgi:tRNA-Thr(GGU) m(6)t(6)A37 methyltransferase TsaA